MFFVVSNVFLILYIGELTARVLADPGGAFRSGWNQFDFTLICMSIFDYWFVTILDVEFSFDFKNLVAFRLFRMAKLLRLIRLVRLFSDLYLLFEGLKDGVRLLLWATVFWLQMFKYNMWTFILILQRV